MLLLNAGWAVMGPFNDLTPLEIEQTVTINALHPIYLIKALLPKLLAREKRSAVLVTSSGLASVPVPGIATYSAAKSFSSYIAEALHIELKDKIDVISFQCGEVHTKLLGAGQKKAFHIITTERATGGSLRDIGSRSMTHGAFAHEFSMWMLPSSVMQAMVFRVSK